MTIVAPSGTDVTLTVSSDAVSDDAIQIAGSKSLTKTAVDGQAVFTVTLSEEAVYQLVGTAEDGTVIDTVSLVVGDGGQDAPPAGGGDGDSAGPALPETGATSTPLLIGAIALLVLGGTAFAITRRGKANQA